MHAITGMRLRTTSVADRNRWKISWLDENFKSVQLDELVFSNVEVEWKIPFEGREENSGSGGDRLIVSRITVNLG